MHKQKYIYIYYRHTHSIKSTTSLRKQIKWKKTKQNKRKKSKAKNFSKQSRKSEKVENRWFAILWTWRNFMRHTNEVVQKILIIWWTLLVEIQLIFILNQWPGDTPLLWSRGWLKLFIPGYEALFWNMELLLKKLLLIYFKPFFFAVLLKTSLLVFAKNRTYNLWISDRTSTN